MIVSASQMAKETDTTLFDLACKHQMQTIKEAAANGRRECLFDPRPTDLYQAVKTEFSNHGYTFHPIGVIGGVRQDGEMICW